MPQREFCSEHMKMAENVASTRATVEAMEGGLGDVKKQVGKIFYLMREDRACVARKNGNVREDLGRLKAIGYLKVGGTSVGIVAVLEVIIWVIKLVRAAP